MDNAELTNEQTEKVLQFQDLTGIDDINICRDVLIRHQWDLEVAFQEQLNIREGRPSMYASMTSEIRAPQVVNDRYLQHVFSNRRDGRGPPGGITNFIGYIINYVFNIAYSTFSSILSTLIGLFRTRETIVTDPLGDVLTFIRNFNDKYPVHPVFYHGTYAQALNDAKRELKFLLVYLHSENNHEVANFCRHTLSNGTVIDYINRNMFFWGCDITSPEGYRVLHSINARSFPIMVVVGLRSNKMIIVGRLEGDCTAIELKRRLETIIGENDIWLSQARAERLERSFTQSLRQQQDEAYELSLLADQEKDKLKQIQLEEIKRQELELEAERYAEEEKKLHIARQKIEMSSQVPSEPDPNSSNIISVLFKLPNGLRIERRFRNTDTLTDLYNYIFCHPSSPDSFEITTNFPKRVLETKDTNGVKTLLDVGLQKREVLFVNDLDA